MRAFVAILRLALAALPSAVLLPAALATRLVARVSAPLGRRLAARVQRAWALGTRRALGVTARGPGAPEGAWLVAANHVSYLDVLVLASRMDVCFVAKAEIAGWPLVGVLSRSVGTIFLDPARPRDVVRAGREVAAALSAGVSVVVFPEGAASAGERVLPFHGSLLALAARGGFGCLPVALTYRTPRAPWTPRVTVAWWGGMPLAGHLLRLAGLGGVEARVACAEPVRGLERRELTRAAERAVRARFEPLPPGPPPPTGPRPGLLQEPAPGGPQNPTGTPPRP